MFPRLSSRRSREESEGPHQLSTAPKGVLIFSLDELHPTHALLSHLPSLCALVIRQDRGLSPPVEIHGHVNKGELTHPSVVSVSATACPATAGLL